jgi:hypothetical protein
MEFRRREDQDLFDVLDVFELVRYLRSQVSTRFLCKPTEDKKYKLDYGCFKTKYQRNFLILFECKVSIKIK